MSGNPKPSLRVDGLPRGQPHVSFFQGLKYRIYSWLLERAMTWGMSYLKTKDKPYWASVQPTFTKKYPVRPNLTHRIHIPPSHKPGQTHPICVLIHGGGFVFGDPSMDDAEANRLAKHGFVVASLDYAKGPSHRFPGPIQDVAALVSAVLADDSLPIDTSQFILGGFSAGAVMTFALAQMPQFKDRVKALVSWCPLTDWSRIHRPEPKSAPWGEKDGTAGMQNLFDWAYIPAGHDLQDKALSPLYISREDVPQSLCIVTGGADTLSDEAALLAERLAGREHGDPTENWSQGGVNYVCAADMPHCFEHFWIRPKGEEWVQRREQLINETWTNVLSWLDQALE